jgi:23S rRNA (cytidine1920-2'-O)/16S rRNA (cytidine1409-2'-O)-methyltransferase
MSSAFVSRAGEKLEHALKTFNIDPRGKTCADFGASTGGFTDCLLQHGAVKVYAVEKGYGTIEWKLRNDPHVVVMERENAMHVELPEKVDLLTVDTSWTKLEKVIPNALKNLKPDSEIVALLKPHYEASPRLLRKGVLPDDRIETVIETTVKALELLGVKLVAKTESPIVGGKGGNREFLLHLRPTG